ncbi:MAG: peptidase M16 [Kordiimonas sp.]|nr:peptidase M16 [Kordiimonas sp.]
MKRYFVALSFFAAALTVCLPLRSHALVNIQEVTSPGGIRAWLVENHTIPMLSMKMAFIGGAAWDPDEKAGLSNMVASLLDEGGGTLTSHDFQIALEEHAISLGFSASRDSLHGSMRTLRKHHEKAFALLRLALTAPRFDPQPLERMRKAILTGLARRGESPQAVASDYWFTKMWGKHPYGRIVAGRPETVATITRSDLKGFAKDRLTKRNLVVAVVGDITAAELATLLDKTFGDLAEGEKVKSLPPATQQAESGVWVKERPGGQTTVVFGHGGIKRDDPDWYAAYVMNYILGGGGLTGRLSDAVREERGLAYSVYSYFYPLRHGGLFMGQVATQNARAGEAMAVIHGEISRLASEGVTEEELNDAKTYLTGSYPLEFDSSGSIAGQLLGMQILGFSPNYIQKRNSYIADVSRAQISRVAARLLQADKIVWSIVGKPDDLDKLTAVTDVPVVSRGVKPSP